MARGFCPEGGARVSKQDYWYYLVFIFEQLTNSGRVRPRQWFVLQFLVSWRASAP